MSRRRRGGRRWKMRQKVSRAEMAKFTARALNLAESRRRRHAWWRRAGRAFLRWALRPF